MDHYGCIGLPQTQPSDAVELDHMKAGHFLSFKLQTLHTIPSLTQLQKGSDQKKLTLILKFPSGPNLNGPKNSKNSAKSLATSSWKNFKKRRISPVHPWTWNSKTPLSHSWPESPRNTRYTGQEK